MQGLAKGQIDTTPKYRNTTRLVDAGERDPFILPNVVAGTEPSN